MCLHADVSCGHPPSVVSSSPLREDLTTDNADKEISTTGRTEALYMYTQEM